METLIDVLRSQAARSPEAVLYRFLPDGETVTASLTFGDLDRRAKAVGAEVQSRFAPRGRLLLVAPAGPEVIIGFLGALYGGALPVPVYPPQEGAAVATVRKMTADADVAGILTSR